MQQAEIGISVIICCYNSASRLPETLKYLARQQVAPGIAWEVIVVNNASRDATAKVAFEEWERYFLPAVDFKIVNQMIPGLSNARIKGIENAMYEYLLFCDDDNWLYPDYVANAFKIINADPKIGVLGGLGIFEPQQPINKEIERFSYYFVNGPQTWANTDHWVYGAGSVYRKSILVDLFNKGWRQITTDRSGKCLISGGDTEICFIIYLSGYKISADDQLKFKHFVPLKRQKISYILDLCFWQSYSHVLLNSYYPILNDDQRPIKHIINGWLLIATKSYLKNLILLFYKKIKWWEKRTVEEKISFNGIYGIWYSLFKNRKKIIDHHEQTKAILANIIKEQHATPN